MCIVRKGYDGEICEPEAEGHMPSMHMVHGTEWDGTGRKRNETEQNGAERCGAEVGRDDGIGLDERGGTRIEEIYMQGREN